MLDHLIDPDVWEYENEAEQFAQEFDGRFDEIAEILTTIEESESASAEQLKDLLRFLEDLQSDIPEYLRDSFDDEVNAIYRAQDALRGWIKAPETVSAEELLDVMRIYAVY